jgi:hypothetical protein
VPAAAVESNEKLAKEPNTAAAGADVIIGDPAPKAGSNHSKEAATVDEHAASGVTRTATTWDAPKETPESCEAQCGAAGHVAATHYRETKQHNTSSVIPTPPH